MVKKLIISALLALLLIFIAMQHSLATLYYLKPFFVGILGIICTSFCLYYIINMMWHESTVIGILAAFSYLLLSLCYTYTTEAKDFKNKQEVVLSDIIGKSCPMKRGEKAVEVIGKDQNGTQYSLYTSHKVFDRLRGRSFNITYLPRSKKIITITSHKKD